MGSVPVRLSKELWTIMLVLHGAAVQAQPPIVVDWIQEGVPAAYNYDGLHINPASHATLAVMSPATPVAGCSTNRAAAWFTPDGEYSAPCCEACLEVYGMSQMFSGSFMAPTGSFIYMTVNMGIWPSSSTSVAGVYSFGPNWVEPITLPAGGQDIVAFHRAHAVTASNYVVFIGGSTWDQAQDEYACPNSIWRYPYPDAANGASWRSCVDTSSTQLVIELELWNDTLLAISFPNATKVETVNGIPLGSFELFTGAQMGNGYTGLSGDTLFWACQFGGSQLHVGRYLINSGPVWEATLPFTGNPVELHQDGMGRLWTAAGSRIIWIDQADGSYESYAVGTTVKGMDLEGNAIAIIASTGGSMSYVLHGHITP